MLPVLAKNHIRFPMQAVFNLPVLVNVTVEIGRRGRQATEVVPGLGRSVPVNFLARVDARNAAQVTSIGQFIEQRYLRFHSAAAAYNTT